MPSYREYQVVLRPGLDNIVKPPRARIRRSHNGCTNCKKRKVKCDETKGTCLRCKRRGDVCVWTNKSGPSRRKTNSSEEEAGTKEASGEKEAMALAPVTNAVQGETMTDGDVFGEEPMKSQITQFNPGENHFVGSLLSGPKEPEAPLDGFFLMSFANNFLPPFAQVHFADPREFRMTVLQAAQESSSLREVFIACGASFVASENALSRTIAHKRYNKAICKYIHSLKNDMIERQEPWLFIAAQVLQILCLREPFTDSNATRCALHFSLAYKFVAQKLSNMVIDNRMTSLDKRLMDNFIFHYPLVILFCDHTQLRALVPDPFQFFLQHQNGLMLAFWDESLTEYGVNPLVAFHIAAKCSWSCRLSLPLTEDQRLVHVDLLEWATKSLKSVRQCHSMDATVQVTSSVTTIVLMSSIILLRKMVDTQGCMLSDMQSLVSSMREEMEKPLHVATVFPIWSLMIAACASMTEADRRFFRQKLRALHERSHSKLIERILVYLTDIWTVCESEDPFELIFDTEFMSQICN